jgi:Zn-dependent peptidase ImmA (M78 family)
MELLARFPEYKFEAGPYFMWLPETRIIRYRRRDLALPAGQLRLLHELGHAILNHTVPTDAERYRHERDAWEVAQVLAEKLGVKVSHQLIARSLRETRAAGYELG